MPEKQYVTYGCCGCGCGTELPITGCRFSLAPMCDDFADVILDAVSKVDTAKVWKQTDKLSTVYRGRACHVEDAVKACFVHAYRGGLHMTMEATFSKGCPGDIDGDSFLTADDTLCNEPKIADIHFPVDCKIALYPMGVSDYMSHIAHIVNHAIDLGIYAGSAHYCTLLSADVQALFSYIGKVNAYCGENLRHYVFEVTMSVNSPTK
ncbi:MAG: thiamine-binding protein [Oscillospiraceae bacterium]|nr:thiamine-binding protein [Oscillospiraceae bacterium]